MEDGQDPGISIRPEKSTPPSRRRAMDEARTFAILNGALVGAACAVLAEVRGPHDMVAGVLGAFAGAACGFLVNKAWLGLPLLLSTVIGAFIAVVGPGCDASIESGVVAFFGAFLVLSVLRYVFWTPPFAANPDLGKTTVIEMDEL